MPGTRMAWMWSQQSDDDTRIAAAGIRVSRSSPWRLSVLLRERGRSGMVTVDTGLALSNALAGFQEPTITYC